MDPQFLGLLSLAFAVAVQLAGISFLLGGLFQRMRSAEARIRELENVERAGDGGRTDLLVRLGQLETVVELSNKQTTESVGGVQRELRGLSRQVASLTTRRRGAVPPMGDTMSED
ncbi:MAG TPA: hypothetical protein VL358_04510 [Caulobacteraceae bacterium]|nr:hypothetical protein [Caulobacteraceae bacterium]